MLGLGTWFAGLAVAFDYARRALRAGEARTLAIVAAVIAAAEALLTVLVLAIALFGG